MSVSKEKLNYHAMSCIRRHKNSDVLSVIDLLDLNYRTADGRGYLHMAVGYDNDEIVVELLKRNIDVNLQNKEGYTALHFAASSTHSHIAKLLVMSGARLDLADDWGNQPLIEAVNYASGNYETIKLFLQAGADPLHENDAGMSPLALAKNMNDLEMVEILENT